MIRLQSRPNRPLMQMTCHTVLVGDWDQAPNKLVLLHHRQTTPFLVGINQINPKMEVESQFLASAASLSCKWTSPGTILTFLRWEMATRTLRGSWKRWWEWLRLLPLLWSWYWRFLVPKYSNAIFKTCSWTSYHSCSLAWISRVRPFGAVVTPITVAAERIRRMEIEIEVIDKSYLHSLSHELITQESRYYPYKLIYLLIE